MSFTVVMRLTQCVLLTAFFLIMVLVARGRASDEQDMSTHITSERLRYSHHDNQIEFIGDVHVHRPGFELRSDKLIVFLQAVPRGARASSVEPDQDLEARVEVEKMIAHGKVSLKHGGRVGHGETATYWVDREVLRLEGNAIVQDGPTKLEGNVITLNVREKGVDAQGRSEQRVEGMFFLPREESTR
ncbi:MAG TPA: hypothetical protein ENN39_04455 [Desulfonatronum sp.]|nr:hypothetical protein [Desulfonatronum sp.]